MVEKRLTKQPFPNLRLLIFPTLKLFYNLGWANACFIALILIQVSGAQAAEKSTCITCHRQSTGNQRVDRNYFKWQESIHSKKGVTCDKCHGGQPGEMLPAVAHVGIVEHDGKKTPLYYKKIDALCGKCHKNEYQLYSTSSPSTLMQQGKGHNCNICHQPKLGEIKSTHEIASSCAECHAHISVIARMLFDNMNQAKAVVESAGESLLRKTNGGTIHSRLKAALDSAKKELSKSKEYWHRFDLTQAERHIKKALEHSGEARKLAAQ